MGRDAQEIRELLDDAFPDQRPSDAEVRRQTVVFHADHWIRRWPTTLATPSLLVAGERISLSRQDIFDKARDVASVDDAVELYVMVAGWGSGTKARSAARCVKPLHASGASNSLLRSFSSIRGVGATEAYRRLYTWEEDRIKFFGPAFFTKWLYFSGYDSWSSPGPAPLILDARVAMSLSWRTTGWSASAYQRYLHLAEEVRLLWAPDQTSHVIEYALFKASSSLEKQGGRSRLRPATPTSAP